MHTVNWDSDSNFHPSVKNLSASQSQQTHFVDHLHYSKSISCYTTVLLNFLHVWGCKPVHTRNVCVLVGSLDGTHGRVCVQSGIQDRLTFRQLAAPLYSIDWENTNSESDPVLDSWISSSRRLEFHISTFSNLRPTRAIFTLKYNIIQGIQAVYGSFSWCRNYKYYFSLLRTCL